MKAKGGRARRRHFRFGSERFYAQRNAYGNGAKSRKRDARNLRKHDGIDFNIYVTEINADGVKPISL
jgi:hypothetical protein